MGRYRTGEHRFFTIQLALVVLALAAASCTALGGGGSEPPAIGADEVLFRYRSVNPFAGTEHWIDVRGDGSFVEYRTLSLSGIDEAALLATSPLNSAVLSDELLDRVHADVRKAHQKNIPEGRFADCEWDDAPSSWYVLAGRSYEEPICRDEVWPFADARAVVDVIFAMDVGFRRQELYRGYHSVTASVENGGALIAGEVLAVTIGADRIQVDATATEAIVGRASLGSTVVLEVGVGAVTEEERTGVGVLSPGDPIWVVVDRSGSGEMLAALDRSGHLIDWGPSTSPFVLGHTGFLAAANQWDMRSRRPRCAADSGYDLPEPSAGEPGDSLAATLQKLHVETTYEQVRRANEAGNRTQPKVEHDVTFVGGDESLSYVVVGESGRYLDSFEGSAILETGTARTLSQHAETSISVFSVDMSSAGCRPDKNLERLTFVALAFGQPVASLAVESMPTDTETRVDLTTGEVSTEAAEPGG